MSQIPSASQIPATTDAFKHIETVVLASAAPSVSLAGLDTSNRAWVVEGYLVNDANAKFVHIQLNGDAANNYHSQFIAVASTTASGGRVSATTQWRVDGFDTVDANSGMQFSALIAKPATGVKGQIVSQAGFDPSAGTRLGLSGGEWNNTSALISRIDVLSSSGNFDADTSVSLYGAPRS